MKNISPLSLHHIFLDVEIYKQLEYFKFYNTPVDLITLTEDKNGKLQLLGEINEIDMENYVVKYTDCGISKVFSLEILVKEELNLIIDKTIDFIDMEILKRMNNPREIESLILFLNSQLAIIKNKQAYFEFNFLEKFYKKIDNHINSLISELVSKTTNKSKTYNYFFNILSSNPNLTIEKLYKMLTSNNPIIECEKENFINAFSGKNINEGIKWKIIAKNKSTNKKSLIFFLEQLIENNFLHSSIILDLNKHIKYVFRDSYGNPLKNIKQSKSSISNNPQDADRILEIIKSL
ncbi:MAG: hypothetical protein ACPGSD_15070 [Flavobacteriales bacterium]